MEQKEHRGAHTIDDGSRRLRSAHLTVIETYLAVQEAAASKKLAQRQHVKLTSYKVMQTRRTGRQGIPPMSRGVERSREVDTAVDEVRVAARRTASAMSHDNSRQ